MDRAYRRLDLLVEPDWLSQHGGEVRIIDCRPLDAYREGHIPGAVHLPLTDSAPGNVPGPWIKDPDDPKHVMRPELFAELMGRLGVSNETTVVAYSDAQLPPTAPQDMRLWFSTRLWWVLSYYGHTKAVVLDGGFRRWMNEGRPISTEEVTPPGATFVPKVRAGLICRLDELRARHRDAGVQVVNVLPQAMYDGTANPLNNKRVGHIPGSVNLNPGTFVDDTSSFRPAAELEKALAEAGVSNDRELIIHCQGGIRTTVAVFALSLLGRTNVRAYDGSMWEWANRDDTPLEVTRA
ncbi:MAG: sulfurtransferase [Actinobacteria bacterium]|nr:sulfurtransferase [Actinomycetota bacterium]